MFFGCALSGPSCQKREFLDTPQKRKFWLITEKLFFLVFLCFLLFTFVFLFFLLVVVFWVFFFLEGLRVRWGLLALNPPYFLFFWFWVFFGGFKGQVRWPEGPPHLALNPPYFFFVLFLFFFFPFLSLLLKDKKPCFPPRKGHFLFIFECLPLFLLSLFWPPPFSISLSLSLSCSILSFFLLVFLFCFLFVPFFLSFFPFLSSLLLFHERNNIKTLNCYFFFLKYFLFFWFPVLLFLSNPFFLSLLFPDFKLCFLFNINVFGFKKQSWKHQFLVKRGVATKRFFFFMNLCFAKCEKLSFFLPIFCPILVDVQKHYKIGISAHF